MRSLCIDQVQISDDSPAYVIAEVGHNHQGSFSQAIELLRAAHAAGASAVKLQKRDNRSLYTRAFYDRPYSSPHAFGATYGEHREALEFGRGEYVELAACARDLGISLFATAFDFPSADFLAELEMPAYKIASGDLRNTPLIRYVARMGKPVLLSTGGATLDDVTRAYDAAAEYNEQTAVLQCTACYPARADELHLNVIATYRRMFPTAVVGLSAHDECTATPIAAFALGGRIFEKHFTLDRAAKGSDHALSLDPAGMRQMVRDLADTHVALGSSQKQVQRREEPALEKMGKHLVAARNLPAGQVLTPDCIAIKSPGGPLQPYCLEALIGQRLSRPLAADEAFHVSDLGAALRRAA